LNARYGGLFVCLAERIIGRVIGLTLPLCYPRPIRVRLRKLQVKANLRGFRLSCYYRTIVNPVFDIRNGLAENIPFTGSYLVL